MATRKPAFLVPLQPIVPIRPPLKVLILYAMGQLGWSLASFSVGNLLIYFYMPPEQGQPVFPSLLLFGKSSDNPLGVQMTAAAALLFCLAGWGAFRKYEELASVRN
jgi:hypothetical protein